MSDNDLQLASWVVGRPQGLSREPPTAVAALVANESFFSLRLLLHNQSPADDMPDPTHLLKNKQRVFIYLSKIWQSET